MGGMRCALPSGKPTNRSGRPGFKPGLWGCGEGVTIEQETLDAVGAFVRLGVFKSRSEALKTLIRIGLSSVGDAANIVKISDRLFEPERTLGYIPVRLDGGFKDLMEMRMRALVKL
ncbi:MAG: ribbon-helix-helix domain-containing protein [Acidilobaceae archaeon]